MEDDKLVAKQARDIDRLTTENVDMSEALERIRLRMVCIGGPLNDNRLAYSNEQLVTFAHILQDVENVLD